MDGETSGAPVERMPPRGISAFVDPRRFARIDDDDSLVVLDDPGVHGEPLRPLVVEQHVGETRQSAAACFHLGTSHLDQTGADSVNCRHPAECAGVATYAL